MPDNDGDDATGGDVISSGRWAEPAVLGGVRFQRMEVDPGRIGQQYPNGDLRW